MLVADSGPLIDEGERSALALALVRGAVVLVDERRGRACAVEMGLSVMGTLGLLVRAREAGLLERLRPATGSLSLLARIPVTESRSTSVDVYQRNDVRVVLTL
ncbi:MAG TPA: hypothetical protein VGM74_20170 [Burkholderiaceae bacterium]